MSSVHVGSLFILFLDYLGVAAWYWWLVGQTSAGRAKLWYISCYVSVMAFVLLVIAILGSVCKSWIIALEVCSFILVPPSQGANTD